MCQKLVDYTQSECIIKVYLTVLLECIDHLPKVVISMMAMMYCCLSGAVMAVAFIPWAPGLY